MPDPLDSRDIINPETHHEKSDVNVRALLWAVVIFIAFAIGTHFAIFMMFRFYTRLFRDKNPAPLTAIAMPADASVPQTPRLQPFPNRDANGTVIPPNRNTPVTDMEDMRAAEEQALRNPGWIDRQKGLVRLPIEVAKRLVLERGLPVSSEAESNLVPALNPAQPAVSIPSGPGSADAVGTATSTTADATTPAATAPASGGGKRP